MFSNASSGCTKIFPGLMPDLYNCNEKTKQKNPPSFKQTRANESLAFLFVHKNVSIISPQCQQKVMISPVHSNETLSFLKYKIKKMSI